MPKVIPGSTYDFDDCPAYYLRVIGMDMPAIHLINDVTHPAHLVSEWATEVENGARNVDTLTPKAREGVHLWLTEMAQRREHENKRRRESADANAKKRGA